MEDEVSKEIDDRHQQKAAEDVKGPRKSRQRRSVVNPGSASINEVKSALGERLRPIGSQVDKAKELAEAKRSTLKAQQAAQDVVDREALGRAPQLPSKPQRSHQVILAEKEMEASQNTDQNLQTARDLGGAQRRGAQRQLFPGDDNDLMSDDNLEGSEEENSMDFGADENEENENEENFVSCCDHCKSLRRAYKQSGTLLVQALATFGNVTATTGVQFAEPLRIPDDVPKSEITKGSKVFLANADKNTIKADGDGDPSKMTRMCLMAVFGRDFLERNAVTARGLKSGTMGISVQVREAIRAFVNRNRGKQYANLTEAQFNRVINRKKNQVHRKAKSSKSPSSSGKKTVKEKKNKPEAEDTVSVPSPKRGVFKSPLKPPQAPSVMASPSKAVWSVNTYQVPSQDVNVYQPQYNNPYPYTQSYQPANYQGSSSYYSNNYHNDIQPVQGASHFESSVQPPLLTPL